MTCEEVRVPLPFTSGELARVLEPDGPVRMLPASAYLDEAVLAWERRHLFDGGWVCVGRTDLPEMGSQRAVAVGGTSILVTRDGDGVLHGFSNHCRHRGHELLGVGESACARAIRCPYHAWTYQLDGRLRHAPRLGDVPGFDPQEHGLVGVPVVDWHGWLVVNLDGRAEPFTATVGGLEALVAPYRPEVLAPAATHTYVVAANWKVIHENYHECYHCPSIHPELVRVSPPDSGANVAAPDGAWIGGHMELAEGCETMSFDGRSGGRRLDGVAPDEVGYYGLLPSLLVSLHPDYVMTHRMEPLDAGRTLVECAWLFPRDLVDGGLDPAYAVEFWDRVNRQDWAACESVQRGIASPGYRPGPLASREDAVQQFVQHLARRYRDGLSSPDLARSDE
jgi:glycine betaine catabolism A